MPTTIEYQITDNDLDRIGSWLREKEDGCTLDAIVRRFIRGRIKYGEDLKGQVLPEIREYVGGGDVLSWDQLEEWRIGSHVLVAKSVGGKIRPEFGRITAIVKIDRNESYIIHIGDQLIKYAKFEPGSQEVNQYLKCIRELVQQEQMRQDYNPDEVNLDSRIDLIILNQGSTLATKMKAVLESDQRFLYQNGYWYLKEWLIPLSASQIHTLHSDLMNREGHFADISTILDILYMSEEKFGSAIVDFSLSVKKPIFQQSDNGWLAIKPPPPVWQNAQGIYYVYDPNNFQILLTPGEKLNPLNAAQLESLGFYADVVERIDWEF